MEYCLLSLYRSFLVTDKNKIPLAMFSTTNPKINFINEFFYMENKEWQIRTAVDIGVIRACSILSDNIGYIGNKKINDYIFCRSNLTITDFLFGRSDLKINFFYGRLEKKNEKNYYIIQNGAKTWEIYTRHASYDILIDTLKLKNNTLVICNRPPEGAPPEIWQIVEEIIEPIYTTAKKINFELANECEFFGSKIIDNIINERSR